MNSYQELGGKRLTDAVTGFVVLALGIGILILLPHQIAGETIAAIGDMKSPAFFAAICGILLSAFGAVLVARGLLGTGTVSFELESPWRVVSAALALVAAVALTYIIGLLPTGGMLIVALSLIFGYRRYWLLALIAILCPVAVYLLFERLLLVLLPRGWF